MRRSAPPRFASEGADSARHSARAALDSALADGSAPRYSIGQAADLLGVRPSLLRRLEASGVVSPARTDGDQRRYSREDLERLVDARALMSEGVSLAGVRRVLDLQDRVVELEAALSNLREQSTAVTAPTPSREASS